MSALGLARGLYLADTEQSFTLFYLHVNQPFMLCVMSIVFQLFLAAVLAYCLRLYGMCNFNLLASSQEAPTARDENIIHHLVCCIKDYEQEMKKELTQEEKETLTSQHIEQVRDLAQNLSTQKQTQFLHHCLKKKIQKLENKLLKHKI